MCFLCQVPYRNAKMFFLVLGHKPSARGWAEELSLLCHLYLSISVSCYLNKSHSRIQKHLWNADMQCGIWNYSSRLKPFSEIRFWNRSSEWKQISTPWPDHVSKVCWTLCRLPIKIFIFIQWKKSNYWVLWTRCIVKLSRPICMTQQEGPRNFFKPFFFSFPS